MHLINNRTLYEIFFVLYLKAAIQADQFIGLSWRRQQSARQWNIRLSHWRAFYTFGDRLHLSHIYAKWGTTICAIQSRFSGLNQTDNIMPRVGETLELKVLNTMRS